LWVGGGAEPRVKTAFKAPVELSKILVEAPSGIVGFVIVAQIDPDEPSAVASRNDLANFASHRVSPLARKEKRTPSAHSMHGEASIDEHSRISTTMDVYAQFVPESQRRALAKMSAMVEARTSKPIAPANARSIARPSQSRMVN